MTAQGTGPRQQGFNLPTTELLFEKQISSDACGSVDLINIKSIIDSRVALISYYW